MIPPMIPPSVITTWAPIQNEIPRLGNIVGRLEQDGGGQIEVVLDAGSGTGPIWLSQATFLLAHIANSGPVPFPSRIANSGPVPFPSRFPYQTLDSLLRIVGSNPQKTSNSENSETFVA